MALGETRVFSPVPFLIEREQNTFYSWPGSKCQKGVGSFDVEERRRYFGGLSNWIIDVEGQGCTSMTIENLDHGDCKIGCGLLRKGKLMGRRTRPTLIGSFCGKEKSKKVEKNNPHCPDCKYSYSSNQLPRIPKANSFSNYLTAAWLGGGGFHLKRCEKEQGEIKSSISYIFSVTHSSGTPMQTYTTCWIFFLWKREQIPAGAKNTDFQIFSLSPPHRLFVCFFSFFPGAKVLNPHWPDFQNPL